MGLLRCSDVWLVVEHVHSGNRATVRVNEELHCDELSIHDNRGSVQGTGLENGNYPETEGLRLLPRVHPGRAYGQLLRHVLLLEDNGSRRVDSERRRRTARNCCRRPEEP